MKTIASTKFVQLAFWLLAIAFVAVLLLRIIIVFSYVPETGGVSVNVLFSIVRMVNGFPLYANPELPPYPVVQYMPLHYYVVSAIAKLLSLQNNIHAISVLNRFLCLAFDLIVFIPVSRILITVFNIEKNFSSFKLRPSIVSATCMSVFLILPNPNYGRVDNLYLVAFAFAVYFMLQYIADRENKVRKLIYAAIAISLGLFTKQSGLFLLAGTGLYLLFINRIWKHTFLFSVSVLACSAILFLLLINNNYFEFYQNTVLGLNNGISLKWFNEVIIKTFFFKMYLFVALGLALAIAAFINGNDLRLQFLAIISLTLFCFSLMASFKWGSSTNYFTEFLTLTFILTAIYISTYNSSTSQQHTSFSLLHLITFFITPFFILSVFNDKGWGHLSALKKSKQLYYQTKEVSDYLKTKLQKGDIVFTTFHKENLLNIELYEHSVFPQREIIEHCTYPKKIFSYVDFSQRIYGSKIKYWVGKKEDQPTHFLDATFNHFVPDTIINDFAVFKYQNQ